MDDKLKDIKRFIETRMGPFEDMKDATFSQLFVQGYLKGLKDLKDPSLAKKIWALLPPDFEKRSTSFPSDSIKLRRPRAPEPATCPSTSTTKGDYHSTTNGANTLQPLQHRIKAASSVSELKASSLDKIEGTLSDESRISSTKPKNTLGRASVHKACKRESVQKAIRTPFFKNGEIVSVRIQHAENASDLYATKVEYLKELDKMQEDLNDVISDSSQPLKNVAVNAKVAAKYDGMWYRARLISVHPPKVQYIDYGNVETCDLRDIKELPDFFANKGLHTTLVRCTTPLSKNQILAAASSTITLRVNMKEGGRWLVDVVDCKD